MVKRKEESSSTFERPERPSGGLRKEMACCEGGGRGRDRGREEGSKEERSVSSREGGFLTRTYSSGLVDDSDDSLGDEIGVGIGVDAAS